MHSLLIDQRSASLPPSVADVKVWASGRRVFVSSLITDMPAERQAARAAISEVGAVPVMFEDLGGQDISAQDAYLAGVNSSEIYVGVFGPRYGIRMQDGDSATHAEFKAAERQGPRLCLFVTGEDPGNMDGSQRDLIRGSQNLYTTSAYTSPGDLQARIAQRLRDLAAEDLIPWVRIGRVFIRAREITHDGTTVSIVADVYSTKVHAELMRLHDRRDRNIPYASPLGAAPVYVSSVSSRILTTSVHQERIVLQATQGSSGASRMAFRGVSADEVARRKLADSLFHTTTLGSAA